MTFKSQLLLEDFNSKYLKVKRVPSTASQTCMGQRLIRPVIDPIPYSQKHKNIQLLSKETIEDFGLTQDDLDEADSAVKHRYNHVKQNIKLASKFMVMRNMQQTFKKTVLAKNNTQNLKLIQNKLDVKHAMKRERMITYQRRWDNFRERRE